MENFKAHILVVDDDDRIRELVKQYLVDNIQNAGYDAGDFAHYLGWQKGKCMEADTKVLGEERTHDVFVHVTCHGVRCVGCQKERAQ